MNAPPPISANRPAVKKLKKSEFFGAGAVIQLVGLIACFLFFPFGLIVGIALLIYGGISANVTLCEACRGKVDKRAKVCPHCRSEFKE